MAVRNTGDWEGWLRFFLRGIYQVSQSATETSRSILNLREKHRDIIIQNLSGMNGLKLLDYLFANPIFSIRMAEKYIGCAYATSANVIRQLEKLGIINEITGQQRNRLFRYTPYLDLFDRQTFK